MDCNNYSTLDSEKIKFGNVFRDQVSSFDDVLVSFSRKRMRIIANHTPGVTVGILDVGDEHLGRDVSLIVFYNCDVYGIDSLCSSAEQFHELDVDVGGVCPSLLVVSRVGPHVTKSSHLFPARAYRDFP
jgi:hypothetical protein